MQTADQQLLQYLKTIQRPINCINDTDRSIRQNGLTTIQNSLFNQPLSLIIKTIQKTNLSKNLCLAIEDKIERNRQLGLRILEKYLLKIKATKQIDTDIIQSFLKTLINRVNHTPFLQTSEQLRLTISKIFVQFVQYKYILISNISDFTNSISKLLADPYPELKKSCCNLINLISKQLKQNIGYHSNTIIKALGVNLAHQHSKVRKATIQSLGSILITQGAGVNLQFVHSIIKACTFDKIVQVRKSTYQTISKLLNGFSVKNLNSYEQLLVGFLLNGLSDENAETVNSVIELLNNVGINRRQLQRQQTERLDSKMKEELAQHN